MIDKIEVNDLVDVFLKPNIKGEEMKEEVRRIIMDAIIKNNMYQFKSESYKFINELNDKLEINVKGK